MEIGFLLNYTIIVEEVSIRNVKQHKITFPLLW